MLLSLFSHSALWFCLPFYLYLVASALSSIFLIFLHTWQGCGPFPRGLTDALTLDQPPMPRQKGPSVCVQLSNEPVLPASPCHHHPPFLGTHGRCGRAGWALTHRIPLGGGRAASPAWGCEKHLPRLEFQHRVCPAESGFRTRQLLSPLCGELQQIMKMRWLLRRVLLGLEPSLGTWHERLLLPHPALYAIKNFFPQCLWGINNLY